MWVNFQVDSLSLPDELQVRSIFEGEDSSRMLVSFLLGLSFIGDNSDETHAPNSISRVFPSQGSSSSWKLMQYFKISWLI